MSQAFLNCFDFIGIEFVVLWVVVMDLPDVVVFSVVRVSSSIEASTILLCQLCAEVDKIYRATLVNIGWLSGSNLIGSRLEGPSNIVGG